MSDPSQDAADHMARNQFRYYLPNVFFTLNPATEFLDNWHIDYLCYTLSRTFPPPLNPTPNNPLRRIIINVPPRTLKSELVSVGYSTFLLGHFPHERIIGASYSGNLAQDMSLKARQVTRSRDFLRLFPKFEIGDKDNLQEFSTTQKGLRYATSVGGTVTGKGGNFIIADDLLDPQKAKSKVERETANDWFDSTLMSRFNKADEGVIIVIMQRLHEGDLTGHLMEKNKKLPPEHQWHLICLPAICPKTQTFHYYGLTKTWEEGELLHPKLLSQNVLDMKQIEQGTAAYVGQYLQRPSPEGGGLIKLKWFKRYENIPKNPVRIIQSWDTAFKEDAGADPSCCTTWMETAIGYYLIDVFVDKIDYPDLRKEVLIQAAKHNPTAILIEDKASGQSLIQDLQKTTTLPVIKFKPEGDKLARMSAESAQIEAGNVYLPYYAHWLPHYEKEMELFNSSVYDDQVDSTSQALKWMRMTNYIQYRVTTG